ncbi:hypothetical protein M758_1G257900 [Ceratodon purpureus]|nr:hypothetical protein M758_1G257900 [Ceratodon purpureus]
MKKLTINQQITYPCKQKHNHHQKSTETNNTQQQSTTNDKIHQQESTTSITNHHRVKAKTIAKPGQTLLINKINHTQKESSNLQHCSHSASSAGLSVCARAKH